MVLSKTTHYPRSISMSHEEFQLASSGQLTRIDVDSQYGKRIASLPGPVVQKLCRKAKLLLVDNDPEKAHFWLVNF